MSQQKTVQAVTTALAHRTLPADPEIGLLLPCNITVRQAGGHTVCTRSTPPSDVYSAASAK